MAITAKDVMELRKQTDCGMMDCKKALTEANGDFEKAIEILRERGLSKSAKKASRVAAEGMAYAEYKPEANVGVVVEVNSETDFVAKNDKFVSFVKNLVNVIVAENPADVEALKACKLGEGTVESERQNLVLVIGENIQIRRFVRVEGHCAAYVHGGGTHAVLVSFNVSDEIAATPEFAAYGKDVAMQVAAANPMYLNREAVPAEKLENEKKIQMTIMNEDPKTASKPDAIKEKMIIGKMNKFYGEVCLVDQAFVKDDKQTVAQYTAQVAKQLGGAIAITGFTHFVKGEGLEKRSDDFAAEVASMVH